MFDIQCALLHAILHAIAPPPSPITLHMKALNVDLNTWEAVASEQSTWRQMVQNGL